MPFMKTPMIAAGTLVIALLSMSCTPTPLPAKTFKSQNHNFRVVELAKGLEHPWSIAFLPNSGILVTERAGRLRLVRNGQLDPKPVVNVPAVVDSGQGGLFDVVLHPKFPENNFLYLSYAARGKGGVNTRVTRFQFDQKTHALLAPKLIFDAKPRIFGGRHFGGRMAFDRKGFLYISTGDRGDMSRAQNVSDHSGSVIRLHDDGRVPNGNPLAERSGAKAEIFSYGHRNPQGMTMHPETGAIWTHEHGARGGDEINIVQGGLNYGWPVITHGIDYDGSKIGIGKSAPGMEQPLYYWVPSIAPSGMAFYAKSKFPKWRSSLFVGALRGEALVRLQVKAKHVVKEERLLQNAVGRVRDVRAGPDGFLYLATDDSEGRLLRLEPTR